VRGWCLLVVKEGQQVGLGDAGLAEHGIDIRVGGRASGSVIVGSGGGRGSPPGLVDAAVHGKGQQAAEGEQ